MDERMGAIIALDVPVEQGLQDLAREMNAIIDANS